ncbi:carbohydrate esterase family 3 [Purpureocillium lavendulum]|uniref:Carbohydrate esterase family 3 n=1 Tax=Purpureocillium lavendulum TaxID=1247861 RepID=A0AB34FNP9_9HYPO|nr:carbohydrate esterase family 3 [Purpureocillium lavendulum]
MCLTALESSMRAPSVPAALTAISWLVGSTSAAAVAANEQLVIGGNAKVERNATPSVLSPRQNIDPGSQPAIKAGTELRILCAGDSITLGTMSETDGGDGDGYRRQLQADLSKDKVVFAGTTTTEGTMHDGYFAAWPGKTIQYISDHIGPSLEQRPNIILLHAGTNDMNENDSTATEGNDPVAAAKRLGTLIDKTVVACPDAVVLVAMIIDTCRLEQSPRTRQFQALIPDVARTRLEAGHKVLAANLTSFPTAELRDCIHPTNKGYRLLGDYWYDVMAQVPRDWIQAPVGPDPERSSGGKAAAAAGAGLLAVVAAAAVAVLATCS